MKSKLDRALALLDRANALEQAGAGCGVLPQNPTLRDFDREEERRRQHHQRIHDLRLEANALAIAALLERDTSAEPALRTCQMCHGVGRAYGPDVNKPCGGCGGSGKQRV